ncbi:CopG family transcriptional regulator [uncultured Sphingomonas sp.]|uniref:CopG family transcriptional regulator n=1 Tax=uncultured Sphingomonas sp. TaxID=158754 RepID=UPI0025EB7C02|nr:CopG family transcriptional regulator [uncultured Sphingomonas sp.]
MDKTSDKVRHQLFLPRPLSDRLEALAARPGATKSAILVDAVTAWLNRRGASELEDRFAIRLDRLTHAIGRVDRDTYVILETLALFIRFELSIQTPLAENDAAGRALGAKRFEAFVTQVGRQVSTGRRSLGGSPQEADTIPSKRGSDR